MAPRLRKLALTAHVIASVGWLGAVACVLGLAVAGLTSQNPDLVRAVYLAMEFSAWYVLVPLALASLATGIVQSLGTKWGLLRHYWVLFKLGINLGATVILVMYTQTLGSLADMADAIPSSSEHLGGLRNPSPVLHAAAALLLLLAATTLAVYKPPGLTRYGRRKQHEERSVAQP